MNGKRLNVIVCDDDVDAAREWGDTINSVPEIDVSARESTLEELSDSLEILLERQQTARTKKGASDGNESLFDNADIVFLDYDMLDISNGSYITGQELAYLVRCYSPCGIVVVMNEGEFASPAFELRLETPVDHFADLRISSASLGNPGLWSSEFIGFRPWSWPILPLEAISFTERIEVVELNLDEPVLEVLQMGDFGDWLSQRAVEALVNRRPLAELHSITFRDIAMPGTTLGIRPKDIVDESLIPRVAAARVSRWLKSLVLPAQDPLIDAPHLVSRFSSLLGDGRTLSDWNRTAAVTSDLAALGLGDTPVSDSTFDLTPWSDRALWPWLDISNDPAIPEVAAPWEYDAAALVFLEDLSQFSDRKGALAFASQVPSMQDIRYVFSDKTPVGERLLEHEKERASSYGVDWDSCNPAHVSRSPRLLLAE